MSIATDIQGTADFIAGWCLHKKNIPHRTAGLLAEKLMALADQVKLLERLAVVHEPARVYANAE